MLVSQFMIIMGRVISLKNTGFFVTRTGSNWEQCEPYLPFFSGSNLQLYINCEKAPWPDKNSIMWLFPAQSFALQTVKKIPWPDKTNTWENFVVISLTETQPWKRMGGRCDVRVWVVVWEWLALIKYIKIILLYNCLYS